MRLRPESIRALVVIGALGEFGTAAFASYHGGKKIHDAPMFTHSGCAGRPVAGHRDPLAFGAQAR
ncbi:MAG: hypothetical protein H0U66_01460 [Gemmatimonadaceae bacterium]|nr:hypothetical protein [Gemmatimonadaceae bacterium]